MEYPKIDGLSMFLMENPKKKWMRTGGSPIFGKPQIEMKPGKCRVYCTCYVSWLINPLTIV
jgi:hypothetical protein